MANSLIKFIIDFLTGNKWVRVILITFILASSVSVIAQTNSSRITGIVSDSSTQQPMAFATIAIYRVVDTMLLTYRLSNLNGEFRIPSLPVGEPLYILITYSGYTPYRKKLPITGNMEQIDLGRVLMRRDNRTLDEVVVRAEIPPIIIRNDTIEFNANSFKTLPNALLEDLLKKLPGVDIDRDGSIKVGGKNVSRILIDGKDFFAGDIRIATRNLPANIIEKVQVTDDRDELDNDPGKERANVSRVINLKLKKAIKNGWFGKGYAGGGVKKKYETGAIINAFSDTAQLSLLGFGNNINKAGFGVGDLQELGGFGRSGMTGVKSSQSGITLGGIPFGGTGQGIQKSVGAGANFNNEPAKNISLNLQYFFGYIEDELSQTASKQQSFKDTLLNTSSISNKLSVTRNHKAAATVRWKPGKLATVTFKPSFSYQDAPLAAFANSQSNTNLEDPINASKVSIRSHLYSWASINELTYVQLFSRKKRALNFSGSFALRNDANNLYNRSDYTLYYPNVTGNYIDQLRDNDISSFKLAFTLAYTEPVGKKSYLRFRNAHEQIRDKDYLNTYLPRPAIGRYDSLDHAMSNGLKRSGWKNTFSIIYGTTIGRINFTPGIDLINYKLLNSTIKNPNVNQNATHITPRLSFSWKDLSFNYHATITEPGTNDLLPLVDNSDPLYLQAGNLTLRPVLIHYGYLNYLKFNIESASTWVAYLDATVNRNYIISARYMDPNGVIRVMPVNTNRNWRAGASLSFSKKWRTVNNSYFTLRTAFNPNYQRGTIIVDGIESGFTNISGIPSISVGFNFQDRLELNSKYAYTFANTKYHSKIYQNFDFNTHNIQSEAVLRWPKHIVWETSVDYFYNSQISADFRKSVIRWNAAFSYLFLKGEQAQIRISIFDILNRNINVSRIIRDNYSQQSQLSTLRRYAMLTLVYNIRSIRKEKVGGRNSLLYF